MIRTHHLLFTGILAITMASCGNNARVKPAEQDSFSIKGQITGIPSGTVKLVRNNMEDRSSVTIDSVPLVDGAFSLRGKMDTPEMMSVQIEPGGWSFPVFVENSAITVSADTTGAAHYDYTAYGMGKFAQIKNFTVSGSAGNDAYNAFLNDPAYLAFNDRFSELNKQFAALKDKDRKEEMRSEFDSLRSRQSAWQIQWVDSFITANPASPAGAYLLSEYFRMNTETPIDKMDSLLGKFTGPSARSVYFISLEKTNKARKALLPGNTAPDFTLLKRDSSSFTLSSTRGKYIMIDFWASWCVPCRKAIPHWKEVYRKYASKGFDIVSVSDDSRWGDWIKAMDEEKMPWMQVIDEFPVKNMPARVGSLYQTHYIPFYVLLDKEGKIILYNPSEEEMDARLKDLLG